MSDGISELNDLPLVNINKDNGSPPSSRLKDVKSATDLLSSLREADKTSSVNRARIQAMFDGTPPYDEAKLRETGQSFRVNLNFGEAESMLENAMSAYVDLVNSVQSLVIVETTHGDAKERHESGKILSEELSRMIRKWPDFNFTFLNLCHHFVTHGVGINYFQDETDWRWRSTGLGDVLIPRGTLASEGRIEVAVICREMLVTELYRFIEDESAAEARGWNLEETRKAILKASTRMSTEYSDSWEKLQTELKNNDLYAGGKSAKVRVAHFFIQEFDGSVSHVISLEDGTNEEFLMKAPSKYGSVSQVFTFFPYGLGTNATYHGIRGLGYKIFPHIQVSNRLRSQVVDAAMLASGVMLQPEDENAMENLGFQSFGPFSLIPPGINIQQRNVPNLSNSVMPVIGDLAQQMNNRAGQYSTQSVFSGSADKTRFEIAAHLEAASKLTVTSLNLFYEPWDRHLREVVRRCVLGVQSEEREPALEEFVIRVFQRGVPIEAILGIDVERTRANRAVGGGSQAKRTVSLQQLNELAGSFDEEGRHNLFRDQVASIVGHDQVDRYIADNKDMRQPEAAKLAELENFRLSEGSPVSVFINEEHVVHLDVHLPFIEQVFAAVEQGSMLLEEATPKVMQVFEHSVEHLQNIQADPFLRGRVAAYNQRLQRLSELIVNGQKRLEKLSREAAEQGDTEEPMAPQADPVISNKIQEHQIRLRMDLEKHQQKLMLNLQEAEQKRQLADAKAAMELQTLLKR